MTHRAHRLAQRERILLEYDSGPHTRDRQLEAQRRLRQLDTPNHPSRANETPRGHLPRALRSNHDVQQERPTPAPAAPDLRDDPGNRATAR